MRGIVSVCALVCCAACAPAVPETSAGGSGKLMVGESRDVNLRFLRFDVTNYERRMTQKDLQNLPRDVRDRMWLLDLDLSSGESTPHLLDNALSAIRQLDPAQLSPAARNMQGLLLMTPDTANLKGTMLERLVDLAPLLGVAPEQVLADLFKINVEDPFLTDEVLAAEIVDNVIGTHPHAQRRLGPKTDENPEGIYPVQKGSVPISLGDVADNFASFSERFGPYAKDGVTHPGFVVGETRSNVLTKDFALTVRANANALPYKGVDLTNAGSASVSSLRSQITGIFDFGDPKWLSVEGLVDGLPMIESMTFRIAEDDQFKTGGQTPSPMGQGGSSAWGLAPYTMERVLVSAAQRAFKGLKSYVAYTPPGHERALFEASVENGWQDIIVQGGLGSPPPASYVWDLLVEVSQVRLHDGGLAEGQADVEFTLNDIPLGLTTAELEERMRNNLAKDPYALLDIAQEIIDNDQGEADFYYYRASPANAAALQGDWLFFLHEDDIPTDENGTRARAYDYRHPGFYADAKLRKKLSSKVALDGDVTHEKIQLATDMRLYVEDAEGAVFELSIGDKDSPNRRALTVTRVR